MPILLGVRFIYRVASHRRARALRGRWKAWCSSVDARALRHPKGGATLHARDERDAVAAWFGTRGCAREGPEMTSGPRWAGPKSRRSDLNR